MLSGPRRGQIPRIGSPARHALLAVLPALVACTSIDLDALTFACRADDECARDTVCDRQAGVCVRSGLDAGPRDAAPEVADAGPPPWASGCSPTVEASTDATEHWWCRGLSADELRAVTDRFGAKLLDLEPERGGPGQTFSAALERKADGILAGWSADTDTTDADPAFFARGMSMVDLDPIGRRGDTVRFSAIFEAQPGAWFYGFESDVGSIDQDVTAALARRGWRTPYGPRMVDLARWGGGDVYAWVVRVRGTARHSETRFHVSAAELEALAATHTVLDLEDSDLASHFAVVTATRAPTDPESHFVHAATAEALDQALAARAAHVRRIVPMVIGGQQRWSALVVRTATSPQARLIERLGDGTAGAPALMLASVDGATVAAARSEVLLLADQLAGLLIAIHALERVQAGELALADPVPLATYPSGTCPTGRPRGTITLGEAVEGALRREPDRTHSARTFLGDAALADLAAELGARSTTLVGILGCPSDASTTTLADLVRLLRGASRRLDASHLALLHAMMWGPTPEPVEGDQRRWNLAPPLAEMVTEEAHRRGVSLARRDTFLALLRTRYLRAVRATGDLHHRVLLGSADLPRCEGGVVVHDTWVWTTAILDAPFLADSERALGLHRAELLRAPLGEALEAFDGCGR